MDKIMSVEVSDLYDDFHEIASLCWRHFEFPTSPNDLTLKLGLSFDDLMDYLEFNLFFAGCSRRLANISGIIISPDKIHEMLRLYDVNGKKLEGTASEYQGHAFDIDRPDNDNKNMVGNIVMGGDLSVWERSEVRIFLETTDDI
jgi:hypothetical protein